MSSNQQIRQSELFSGQDWTVLYRAFTQINFNASDPASINTALQNYIQTNYPEDFNDWIEDQEFVMIIDLLSWLAGTLAFRTDVNARENFLETAQARESVLRLARFLSYNARRAQSARGLVKITNVKTSQSVFDSFGTNLNNQTINWNDPDNPDWMEQFTVVLNAAFPTTNPFGIPLKSLSVSSIPTQLYALTNVSNPTCVYSYSANVDGTSNPFEIVNTDFDTVGFSELDPDPSQAFHIVYRNDGLGNSSTRTGFFMLFKQGTLQSTTYYLPDPIENRTIDINVNNISQTDVWVQSIDSSSNITTQWTQVPTVITDNITFNSVAPSVRSIYSVITQDNDQVTMRFGDGTFGDVPVGNLRLWYRTVNGQQYQLRPSDMQNCQIVIPYTDVTGRNQTLTLTFSLQETVANAVASEDIDAIRRRAPQSFASQNRMVSGEDYNVYPLTSNEIVKMHAVNRIYSGHSRYLDINDPTSTYQDTVVYSDDGWMYTLPTTQYLNIPTTANLTPEQLAINKLQPMLNNISLRDYFINLWMNSYTSQMTIPANTATWVASTGAGWSATGGISINSNSDNNTIYPLFNFLTTGAQLKVQWTDMTSGSAVTKTRWVKISQSNVLRNVTQNTAGAIPDFVSQLALSNALITDETIQNGASIIQICPAFRPGLSNQIPSNLAPTELQQVQNYFTTRRPFSLWYQFDMNTLLASGDMIAGTWNVLDINSTGPVIGINGLPAIHVADIQYVGSSFWTINIIQGLKFVFQSMSNVQWYNDASASIIDANTGLAVRDHITFLQPSLTGVSFDIMSAMYESDGFIDPTRVIVTPTDSDNDGNPDTPDVFQTVVANNSTNFGYVFFYGDPTTQDSGLQPLDINAYQVMPENGQFADGTIFCLINTTENIQTFYKYVNGAPTLITDPGYVALPGAGKLQFQWKHYADLDTRIDPAITNVIDAFVLTYEYDFLIRQWIAAGCDPSTQPKAPTDVELAQQFASLEQYKMFSDQIVWRPVNYKFLFGSTAETELQAQFKVVKIPNTTMSDGEIRSNIIAAINSYFDVNKWEFGETFYYTELAAYIHIQLATAISSVVIVPTSPTGVFGNLFEVRSNSDELFISTAQVSDIVIVNSNTASNLRIS
jgi:hypothetical protein